MEADFSISHVEDIFQGFVFDVERRHVSLDGIAFDREVVVHPGAVAILALDKEDNVILVRQYRAAVEGSILEIPAGTCDIDGESTRETAERELLEETGFSATSFELLGTFLNSPGYSSQRTAIFLARHLREGSRAPAGVEEQASTVERIPLADVLQQIKDGTIVDQTTCLAALLVATRHDA